MKNNVHFYDNIRNDVIDNTRKLYQNDPSIPQLSFKYPKPAKLPVSSGKMYCLPIDKDLSPRNVIPQNGK